MADAPCFTLYGHVDMMRARGDADGSGVPVSVLQLIAFIVAVPFLLLFVLLASIAFRGGERAGYHQTAAATEGNGARRARRTRINPLNQLFVWGLALTLFAATIALLVATVAYDSWTWL